MNSNFAASLDSSLDQFRKEGVYKRLNYLESPQAARVHMEGRGEVLVMSSNNYLGLCDEPSVVQAGKAALDKYGAGTGSVRFICGTFTIHREIEKALAGFVGTESSLTYVSAWNANEGLTATVVEEGDAVISDALNHASIIDSMRLAKAITKCTTAVYKHSDMDDLKARLEAARGARANVKPMPNRVTALRFNRRLYRKRNLVERFFNKIKHYRAVATRYDKRDDNFLAGIKLASIRIWLRFNESMT